MTDDPTPTAEQVATEAIRVACFEAPKATSSTEWRSRIERILSDYRSALRNSPDALADLNGGEWVQIVDPDPPFTLWVDSEGGTWWTKDDDPPRPDWTPAYRFVPREAQQ